MSSKHSPKKHGMTRANELRPKSKLRKRLNKKKASERRAARRAVLAGL